MEQTLVILKPDCYINNISSSVLDRLLQCNLQVVYSKFYKNPPAEFVLQHYTHLQEKNLDAFNRNTSFLINGPIHVLIFEGYNAISIIRSLTGPTCPSKAPKNTIRGFFSTDSIEEATKKGRGLYNVIHSSDSLEEAQREINLWTRLI